MNKPEYGWAKVAAMVWSVPLLILVATGIGLGSGMWLDSKLGTKPWLAIVLTLIGLAAGLYESAKILIDATRENGD